MRQCDGCTECCEGYLFGNAHGLLFQAGRPCHFKCPTGCSIYENRPDDPCKGFTCCWLVDLNFPEWMKPNLSKVIIGRNKWKNGEYLVVYECGQKIDSVVLNWLYGYHYASGTPLRVQVGGGWYNYGPKEFLEESPGMCFSPFTLPQI